MNRIVMIDIANWQVKVDFNLLKAAGVEMVIIKCSMGGGEDVRFRQHIEGALAAGLRVAVYHWVDPTQKVEYQWKWLEKAISGYPQIEFIALDVEQYWADWNKYTQAALGQIPGSAVPHLAGKTISDHAKKMTAYVKARVHVPVLIYTANWFITGHAPQMLDWIIGEDLWLAIYPFAAGRIQLSWAEMIEKWLPKEMSLTLPRGVKRERVKIWQCSGDKFQLPGVWADERCSRLSALDIDIADRDQFNTWTGYLPLPDPEPKTEPEPEPKPVVTTSRAIVTATAGLNLRLGPGTDQEKIGLLRYGSEVQVAEVVNGWAHLVEPAGWVCDLYLSAATAKPVAQPKPYVVTAPLGLNVRKSPDVASARLVTLPYRTRVSVSEISNGWARLADRDGWMSAQWLKAV